MQPTKQGAHLRVLIADCLYMSAPDGRGSVLILADAKVRNKSETKESYSIKFVNDPKNSPRIFQTPF